MEKRFNKAALIGVLAIMLPILILAFRNDRVEAAFGFGVSYLTLMLLFVILFPKPTAAQRQVFRIALCLSVIPSKNP